MGTSGEDVDDGAQVKTYVFEVEKSVEMEVTTKGSRIGQIVPSLCVLSPCLLFGLMLGWLSPTVPRLLDPGSEIPVTMDQTAAIAGFLMIGNLFGSTFSWLRPFGLKHGVLAAAFLVCVGWLVVWQALDVPYVLAGRFLVGFGNGYATPQSIDYINENAEGFLQSVLVKFGYLFLMLGALVSYCVTPYVGFRVFPMGAFIFSVGVTVMVIFVPHSPGELLRDGRVEEALKRVEYLKGSVDFDGFKREVESKRCKELGVVDLVKSKDRLKKIPGLLILVVLQQFSGPPPIIVYSNVIFDKFGCLHPEIFSIIYISFYFVSIIFASFYSHKFNIKYALIFTSLISSFAIFAIAYLTYLPLNPSWVYVKSLILIIFIFIHSIGLGFMPSVIAPKFFEPNALKCINRIQVGLHCICAIVSTKLFQMIITYSEFYLGFVYIGSIGAFGTLVMFFLIPGKFDSVNDSVVKTPKPEVESA